jgi:hypothetical protein
VFAFGRGFIEGVHIAGNDLSVTDDIELAGDRFIEFIAGGERAGEEDEQSERNQVSNA